MRVAAIIAFAFALVSCNRNPEVARKRYMEMGNTYYSRNQFKQAALLYRNALTNNLRYGPAYYKLGLTDLKLGQVLKAAGEFRRAIELLPPNSEDRTDATIKLADIYIMGTRDKRLLDEVDGIAKDLLKKDRNSYDGHRLTAELTFVSAQQSFQAGHPEDAKTKLREAIEEYRKANAAKPGQMPIMVALARSLAADQQLAESEALFKELLSKNKTFVRGYTELYQLYMMQKRSADAEGVLKTAISNNPKQYAYLTLLAAHYYGMNRRDDMVRVLADIKSHAKEFNAAYLTTGDFYLRLGDGDEAIRQYKEGAQADAKNKATYQKRIIEVLMRQGKRAQAADINETILKENPKDTDSRGLQASLLLDKGDVQKAIAELQSVVTSAPDNFVAHFNLGRAHAARGEYEQARQQYGEAIRLRPDYLPARVAQAQLQAVRGDYDAALKSAGEILQFDRGNMPARLIQSAALLGLKKFAESRELLVSMLKVDPNSTDTLFQLGVVNLADNKYKEAEDSFRKAYQLEPTNSRGIMGVVETYMAQNKEDQALQILQAESQKNPKRMDYHLAIGNTAVRTGRYDLAIAEFQIVADSMEKGSRAAANIYLRIGETCRRKGDLNAAVVSLQKASAILPDDTTVLSTLALALDSAQRKQEARVAYERCLKIDPRNAVALNNLAYLLAENNGDLDQALTYAQRAKQILPQLSEISDTLGEIYLKKALTDNALEQFKEIVAKQPTHATYRYHLGLAYAQKGDKMKAVQELKQALKSSPSKDEESKIKQLLQKLG